ncbi:MAG: hypothetical protein ACRC7F_00055 [Cetobacterium sp.]|uniref:hypothetical protein n=1 Tax=unclassified Cetobacterium TaxID=2630983 RepID=UPI0012E02517|nr:MULTISPECIES: hypothetical protein [unclassified Cetobacterium]
MKKLLITEENEILQKKESFMEKSFKVLFLIMFVGSYLLLLGIMSFKLLEYIFIYFISR